MLASNLREANQYHKVFYPLSTHIPFAERDIRFAELLDWVETQEQSVIDIVTLVMHLVRAYDTKFSPLEHSPSDDAVLEKVEKAQQRLGVNFLYTREDRELES